MAWVLQRHILLLCRERYYSDIACYLTARHSPGYGRGGISTDHSTRPCYSNQTCLGHSPTVNNSQECDIPPQPECKRYDDLVLLPTNAFTNAMVTSCSPLPLPSPRGTNASTHNSGARFIRGFRIEKKNVGMKEVTIICLCLNAWSFILSFPKKNVERHNSLNLLVS